MPLHQTVRKRLELTKDLIPAFVDSWAEIFGENEDEHYDALVDELRAGADERVELFRSLEAAIPLEAHGLLRSFDAAWSRQADAREDAAYVMGGVIGSTRRCSACQVERDRTAKVFREWTRAWGREGRIEAASARKARADRCAGPPKR